MLFIIIVQHSENKVKQMAKNMKIIAVSSVVLFILFSTGYIIFPLDFFLTMAITCGTIAYHFCIRLLVGFIVDRIMHNRADYHKPFYRVGKAENNLYKLIKVKKWKNRMPTYSPDTFSPEKHTWSEIAEATCQSEIVHEINVVLSFLPLAAVHLFGSFLVFLLTSIGAATFDLMFVIMQRYNRQRIIKIADKEKARD